MRPPDVVYVLKESELNEELRYSLRSVATNYPEARVWLVGYKPTWVTNVEHIPVKQVKGQKHPNSLRNQRAALTSLTISDPFWFWNDDMFLLSLTNTGPPVYHWGYVDSVLDSYGPSRLGTSYYRSMVATRGILSGLGYTNPLSYAAHVPLLTHKTPMLDALDKYNQDGVFIQHATIYANLIGLGGIELPHGDVKIYDAHPAPLPAWIEHTDLVSTSDLSFLRGPIGRWIQKRFPEPCRFEV